MSKTQEIDELQGILFKKLPNDWYNHIDIQGVPQASIHKDAVESIMNIISDWHNKRIEEVLDRLLDGTTTIYLDTQPNNPVEGKIDPMFFRTEIKAAIEAERKKLKESE